MPVSEVQRFYQKVQHDFDFFSLLIKAIQTASDECRKQAVVDFANTQGFDFTADDFRRYATEADFPNGNSASSATVFNWDILKPESLSQVLPISSPEAKLSVNKLERLFVWLSGASPRILATCPESEQKKHAALGGAVLIPALLAIVTASFLLYTLNFSVYVIIPVSLLWSCMILLMDRALLATYRKGFSFWGKLGQFSLRFFIALLIAVTVAHPVVLLLFSERIDAAYNAGRIQIERNNLALQCDLKTPTSNLRLLDEKITMLRNELKNGHQFFEPPICTNSAPRSKQEEELGLEKLTQELNSLKTKQVQAEQDVALFIANAEKEKKGMAENGFTGIRGCKKGTQCKKWLSQASNRKDDSIELGKEIVALEAKISTLNEKMANQLIEGKQASIKQCEKEREELKSIRIKQHELDQQSLVSLNDQRSLMVHRCTEKDTLITNLKPDVLTQTELLTQLIFPGNQVSWHNLLIFLVFMLLFLAIDMLAVVLKMARIGIYEIKVDMLENRNKFHEFIHQRYQLVSQFSELVSKEQTSVDHLKVTMLKQALDENLKALIGAFTQSDCQKLDRFFKD